jgi:hypothetical protein
VRGVFLTAILGMAGVALGQVTPPPAPVLSTADRVAIQTFEKSKQDAQKMFNDAQQGEISVLREWQVAHPGWTVNPQTFAVEAEKKATPDPAKVEPKKEDKK